MNKSHYFCILVTSVFEITYGSASSGSGWDAREKWNERSQFGLASSGVGAGYEASGGGGPNADNYKTQTTIFENTTPDLRVFNKDDDDRSSFTDEDAWSSEAETTMRDGERATTFDPSSPAPFLNDSPTTRPVSSTSTPPQRDRIVGESSKKETGECGSEHLQSFDVYTVWINYTGSHNTSHLQKKQVNDVKKTISEVYQLKKLKTNFICWSRLTVENQTEVYFYASTIGETISETKVSANYACKVARQILYNHSIPFCSPALSCPEKKIVINMVKEELSEEKDILNSDSIKVYEKRFNKEFVERFFISNTNLTSSTSRFKVCNIAVDFLRKEIKLVLHGHTDTSVISLLTAANHRQKLVVIQHLAIALQAVITKLLIATNKRSVAVLDHDSFLPVLESSSEENKQTPNISVDAAIEKIERFSFTTTQASATKVPFPTNLLLTTPLIRNSLTNQHLTDAYTLSGHATYVKPLNQATIKQNSPQIVTQSTLSKNKLNGNTELYTQNTPYHRSYTDVFSQVLSPYQKLHTTYQEQENVQSPNNYPNGQQSETYLDQYNNIFPDRQETIENQDTSNNPQNSNNYPNVPEINQNQESTNGPQDSNAYLTGQDSNQNQDPLNGSQVSNNYPAGQESVQDHEFINNDFQDSDHYPAGQDFVQDQNYSNNVHQGSNNYIEGQELVQNQDFTNTQKSTSSYPHELTRAPHTTPSAAPVSTTSRKTQTTSSSQPQPEVDTTDATPILNESTTSDSNDALSATLTVTSHFNASQSQPTQQMLTQQDDSQVDDDQASNTNEEGEAIMWWLIVLFAVLLLATAIIIAVLVYKLKKSKGKRILPNQSQHDNIRPAQVDEVIPIPPIPTLSYIRFDSPSVSLPSSSSSSSSSSDESNKRNKTTRTRVKPKRKDQPNKPKVTSPHQRNSLDHQSSKASKKPTSSKPDTSFPAPRKQHFTKKHKRQRELVNSNLSASYISLKEGLKPKTRSKSEKNFKRKDNLPKYANEDVKMSLPHTSTVLDMKDKRPNLHQLQLDLDDEETFC